MSFNYPINVYKDVLNNSKAYDEFANLIDNHQWTKVIDFRQYHKSFANASRLPTRPAGNGTLQTCLPPADLLLTNPAGEGIGENKAKLFTCLHQAAHGRAGVDIIKKFIDLGALRSLKTQNGLTAYDIAKTNEVTDENVINILKVPDTVTENKEIIEKMEKALHEKVIMGEERGVKKLLENNGQELPQISILWEMKDGEMWYPVPGMYGGFSIQLKKEERFMVVESSVRVCGGSEMKHLIDKEGIVTDRSDEVRGTYA